MPFLLLSLFVIVYSTDVDNVENDEDV